MAMLKRILSLALLTLIFQQGWTIGQNSMTAQYGHNECTKKDNSEKNGIKVQNERPRDNCTCKVGDQEHKYPDGYPCLVLTTGYDGENNYKHGTCKDGKCVYTEIPYGCEDKGKGTDAENKRGDQVGCGFTCFKNGTQYHGFFGSGTPCQHALGGEKYINGTCVKENNGTKVLCKEKMLTPAC